MTYMKKIIYLITLSVLLFAGCSKHHVSPKVPEQFDRYIFFSQQVQTKAELIESGDAMGQFGVVGFKYDKDQYEDFAGFISANPTQEPNVFFDDAGARVDVETCWVDGTNASYAPLQGWSNSKKYSFFAYYPIENDHVTLVNTADGTAYSGGVPAIKYTMSGTDFKESMVDVMVAAPHTNLDGSSSDVTSNDVTFSFNHCLSSLGVNIQNASAGSIEITGVSLALSNIKYSTVIIPLDGTAEIPSGSLSDQSCDLLLADAEKSIASGTTDHELSDKLILIPQNDENLSVGVTISYKRIYGSGDDKTEIIGQFATPTASPLKTTLLKGKKHLIHLKFTDSTVEVTGQVSNEDWVPIPDVESSFN